MVMFKIPLFHTVVLLQELSFPLVYLFTDIKVHSRIPILFKAKLCYCHYLFSSSTTHAFLQFAFATQPSMTELGPQQDSRTPLCF